MNDNFNRTFSAQKKVAREKRAHIFHRESWFAILKMFRFIFFFLLLWLIRICFSFCARFCKRFVLAITFLFVREFVLFVDRFICLFYSFPYSGVRWEKPYELIVTCDNIHAYKCGSTYEAMMILWFIFVLCWNDLHQCQRKMTVHADSYVWNVSFFSLSIVLK